LIVTSPALSNTPTASEATTLNGKTNSNTQAHTLTQIDLKKRLFLINLAVILAARQKALNN
jgi:hypothetical protein